MEGLKELLAKHKEKELSEAQFEEELNQILPKGWIPKDKYNELNEKHKALETQNADYLKKIEEATKNKTSIEDLNKQIADMKSQHEAELQKKEAEYESFRKDSFINSQLEKSGVRTPKAVRGLLDLEKVIKGSDGVYSGLQEQIDALKKDETTSYLFNDGNKNGSDEPHFGSGGSGTGGTGNSHEANILARMGVTD